jgi:hypothetical protein
VQEFSDPGFGTVAICPQVWTPSLIEAKKEVDTIGQITAFEKNYI